MASQISYRNGDRVRHRKRPEWGIGSVVKTEEQTLNGQRTQRVSVRFPNAGMKVLSAAHAELEHVASNGAGTEGAGVAALDPMHESGWLKPMAERKTSQIMTSLPMEARDPFNSLAHRLRFTLELYRFDRTGRNLVDWSVAQSGLDDPLSRFSRQELEQHFDRWASERDAHLRKLVDESQNDPTLLRDLLAKAPPPAREAVRRITTGR
jgi:hypothetical protein